MERVGKVNVRYLFSGGLKLDDFETQKLQDLAVYI